MSEPREVRKISAYMHISEELAMDHGLIPDTRPPRPRPPWRTRMRWAAGDWRREKRRKLGFWIAGVEDEEWT